MSNYSLYNSKDCTKHLIYYCKHTFKIFDFLKVKYFNSNIIDFKMNDKSYFINNNEYSFSMEDISQILNYMVKSYKVKNFTKVRQTNFEFIYLINNFIKNIYRQVYMFDKSNLNGFDINKQEHLMFMHDKKDKIVYNSSEVKQIFNNLCTYLNEGKINFYNLKILFLFFCILNHKKNKSINIALDVIREFKFDKLILKEDDLISLNHNIFSKYVEEIEVDIKYSILEKFNEKTLENKSLIIKFVEILKDKEYSSFFFKPETFYLKVIIFNKLEYNEIKLLMQKNKNYILLNSTFFSNDLIEYIYLNNLEKDLENNEYLKERMLYISNYKITNI